MPGKLLEQDPQQRPLPSMPKNLTKYGLSRMLPGGNKANEKKVSLYRRFPQCLE